MKSSAVILATVSIVISVFALGWNVYRDVILRPKIAVWIGVVTAFTALGTEFNRIEVRGTNFGPGDTVLEKIVVRFRRKIDRAKYGVIIPDPNSVGCDSPNKRLKRGHKAMFCVPVERNELLGAGISHVGVIDSFGRYHWASRRILSQAREDFTSV